MTLGDRIREQRLLLNLTQEEVAKKMGIAKSTFSAYENGHREPDLMKLKQLVSIFNVSGEYLLGLPEPINRKPNPMILNDTKEIKLIDNYRTLQPPMQEAIYDITEHLAVYKKRKSANKLEKDLETPELNNIIFFEDIKKERKEIPFLGQMAMGVPIDGDPEAYEGRTVFVDSTVAADYALLGVGDSMEPKIPDGSIVLVKETTELLDGQIGVFDLDNEYSCKIFRKPNGNILLESINPAYDPLSFDSVENVTIKGRIVGILEEGNTR